VETQVRTPQMIFMQPQRLVVPLFQRPYVWNEENQWDPLWNDVVRIAERVLQDPIEQQQPHFLGAVVLQQVQNSVGTIQERSVIDGQQRLTTLQLFFDSLHNQLLSVNAMAAAKRIESLVMNDDAFCKKPDDRFKVWPTNRDRPAFNEVMAAPTPIDYSLIELKNERMVLAHRFFGEKVADWLNRDGPEHVHARAEAIETSVRDLLQVVVIDLNADENAQEIFETLNARGASLTAADLIKNFIFQRLLESGANVEIAYEQHWKEFETAFWEKETSVGRIRYPRSSIFLNHWLVSKTAEEVVAREIFTRFKRYAFEAGDMLLLLEQLNRASDVYKSFILGGEKLTGPLTRLQLFAYRTSVQESEVFKPLLLFLLDPESTSIPEGQMHKALAVVESWMVRRMLIRATTKNYNSVVADLIKYLREGERTTIGDRIENYFTSQRSESRYWPDDNEVRDALRTMPVYRRLQRGRLRMVLEAIEDYLRGWQGKESGLGGERAARATYAIEHIMPRKWTTHWPHPDGARGEVERESLIHTLGNLTLLTTRLNSKVSNGPWLGESGKRQILETHDVLLLNRELLRDALTDWTDAAIRSRTDEMSDVILKIWPSPEGYKSGFTTEKVRVQHRVDLSDLISADCLSPGLKLTPRSKKHAEAIVTLLPDGRLDVDGAVYANPSQAARAITGQATNGWYYFLVDEKTKLSLKKVRNRYLESISGDVDDDDDETGE